MITIYKKEVRGFLTSMTGYVFIAFLLVVCGIYFTAYHLQGALTNFAYTLNSVLFVFLIAVPILTMRVLAEEKKQKTDQLLLTAPVSVTEIVTGKFLALVTVFFIPVLILAFYPLILSQFGDVSFPESYTALFGFFLLGSSFLAIGLYLSSVTESQVIAAVLTFLVLFVCYVSEGIASFFPETSSGSFYTLLAAAALLAGLLYAFLGNVILAVGSGTVLWAGLILLYLFDSTVYEGLVQDIFGILDLTKYFTEFSSGIFDLSGVVYYGSIIGVFLFLAVQSIQKRRWS